nr:hypothetical protein [Xenorhabdus szentirmaii]
MPYADFSYANLNNSDFRTARFMRTLFHRTQQVGTLFSDRQGILENDPELFTAEAWSLQHNKI